MSAATPVSRVRTSAAVAEGATPNTARPSARSWSTAGVRAVVFPVPAGPTTNTRSSQPATAAAASACNEVNGRREQLTRVGVAVAVGEGAAIGPGQQGGLLGQDGLGGEGPIDSRLAHRTTIPA